MSVQQWHVAEYTFVSDVNYAAPFTDVEVTATFTHSSDGQVISRPAFWDGGKKWKVRFAPTELGEWTFVTSSSDTTNAGLHHRQGVIQVSPNTSTEDIYQHGFLQVADSGRDLSYDDGVPLLLSG
ncbi:DUF5060 domain-containing protein [Microbacterium natoriense]|nr:DUF5060 domain-containing protein [Microbacterium natoriense]